MAEGYQASRYNFYLAAGDRSVLWNARTGALLKLGGADARLLAQSLCQHVAPVDAESLAGGTLEALASGGFMVPAGTDELAEIRESYLAARRETPIVLTLTTTMDCNLGCYYCYEERSGKRLQVKQVPDVVALARTLLMSSGKRSLHVDWYGGEPLLNAEFLESASSALQALCAEVGAAYHASIISNGTVWPDEVGGFIARHRIRQVQISFDGLQRQHDIRRRYRPGRAPSEGASSFERVWDLVGRLLYHVRVDVRFNLDRNNQADLLPFVERAQAAGWFTRPFPAVIQPARLSAYSERSAFLRAAGLPADDYDNLRAAVRGRAAGLFAVEEAEVPDGLLPRTSVCAALARDSAVVGADGLLYRCGLQVGERQRATGGLRMLPDNGPDRSFWDSFDPTQRPQCSRCSFLPVCWGGCPKKHLENDVEALAEQSSYWRRNLPRLIAGAASVECPTGFQFSEQDQFRDGSGPSPVAIAPRQPSSGER